MIAPSESLIAPLVVASHAGPRGVPSLGNALLAAADTVPPTYEDAVFKPAGRFKSWERDGQRTYQVVTALGEKVRPHNIVAGFYLKPSDRASQHDVTPVEQWCVGLRVFGQDPFGYFDDSVVRVGVLETLRVRVTNEGFVGACELALLRHLWLSTLRSADPDLIVHGGDGQWSDRWAEPLDTNATTTS